MIATSCLLIESLQTFYDGNKNTKAETTWNGKLITKGSGAAFIRFFNEQSRFFPELRTYFPISFAANGKDECAFYRHVRCGILHQAETTGRYCIALDDSVMFSHKTVNARKFMNAVDNCALNYLDALKGSAITSDLWGAAAEKIRHICNNFEGLP